MYWGFLTELWTGLSHDCRQHCPHQAECPESLNLHGIRNPLAEDENHAHNWGFGHEQTSLVGQGTVVDTKLQGGIVEALRVHHPERESFSWKRKGYTKQSRGRSVIWNDVRVSMTILWLSINDTLLYQEGRISFLPPFIHSLIHLWFITAAPSHWTLYNM